MEYELNKAFHCRIQVRKPKPEPFSNQNSTCAALVLDLKLWSETKKLISTNTILLEVRIMLKNYGT